MSGNMESKNESSMKTFELSEKVTVEKVSYKNRYGITVVADMYLLKDMDKSKKYPAIAIGTPYGGVKEQGAGIYAQNMAERGFVAIAFDESFNGESSGEPRHVSSPDIFVEDFSAGVDFLGTRPFVDRNRIGAIGICGSGGFSITAAQVDPRIKAVATASMYDISSMIRDGFGKTMTDEQRAQTLVQLGEQRWKDFENGTPEVPLGFPGEPADSIPEGLDPISSEFFEYYGMGRGHHPNAGAAFTITSSMSFMNFPLMNYIDTISPRPILFIIGENAHSRYFSEDAYERAAEPKELYIVPGARHIDLYDRTDMIPFDKLESFFAKYLGYTNEQSGVLQTEI
ncbi:alpha/beta hydrolase [Methanosarcina sp. DH1]|uniref:alpha/beta hydrolase n=1 Tax=Methanosarcina sp. DH1 TaxID=2605695 RepID=UPI001E65A09B|nr:alpha/beta hydrolase [Methanosarcina sp. DH1]MCC4766932.1 alpha/beta hydrolase [Methanosarcina sp. DH1]